LELLRGCYLLRAISRSLVPLLRVRTSSVPSVRCEIGPGLWVHRPQIQPTLLVVIMNASDFQTDRRRLTGPAGLLGRLNFGLPRLHRPGPPRLCDACLADVPATLTPTEFAGADDWVPCEHRPSHSIPAARRLRCSFLTRLIRCGSSSFRPIGSIPDLL